MKKRRNKNDDSSCCEIFRLKAVDILIAMSLPLNVFLESVFLALGFWGFEQKSAEQISQSSFSSHEYIVTVREKGDNFLFCLRSQNFVEMLTHNEFIQKCFVFTQPLPFVKGSIFVYNKVHSSNFFLAFLLDWLENCTLFLQPEHRAPNKGTRRFNFLRTHHAV